VNSQPVAQVVNVIVESPQISIPLGVAPMKRKGMANPLVTRNGHQQIDTIRSVDVLPCGITAPLPHDLTKFTILILNLELTLVQINNVPSAFPEDSIWECCVTVLVANMHIQRKIRLIRCGGCRLPRQTKPLLCPDNL
jgi:hypothetical protein